MELRHHKTNKNNTVILNITIHHANSRDIEIACETYDMVIEKTNVNSIIVNINEEIFIVTEIRKISYRIILSLQSLHNYHKNIKNINFQDKCESNNSLFILEYVRLEAMNDRI
jgi:hypothetical protein